MLELLNKYIDKKGQLSVMVGKNIMVVDVEVIDVKSSYGKDLLLVRPVAGSGSVWKDSDSIKNII